MKRRFVPDAECVAAATEASGGVLGRADIDQAFQDIFDFKSRLEDAGDITNMGDRLRTFAEKRAQATRTAAVVKKRHAALNVLVRDRQFQAIDAHIKAGLNPREAILAVMEGSQKAVPGARKSVAALNLAYESRYAGDMMAAVQRERPHLVHALGDPRLDADIVREMAQLGKGGKPGITGNADAQAVAKIFGAFAERARTDLNAFGASIGKLNGWFGVQLHDDIKMLHAGKEAWVESVKGKIDAQRTFGDEGVNVDEALGKLFDEFVTGFRSREVDAKGGEYRGPANLANALGEHRVLHFKTPDHAIAYRTEFGHGNTFSGMVSYLRQAARTAALMDALGPNPEHMFRTLVEGTRARVAADASMSADTRNKAVAQLDAEAGALKQAVDIATGLASRPVNVTAAKISQDIRAVQSMAKLGGSTISSLSDVPTAAVAAMFRGSGFAQGLVHQLGAIFAGRPKGEIAELSYILGEGFDGIIGHIVNPAAAVDGPVGFLSKLQENFFRLNFQSWWTDVNRAAAGRMIAAEMGMRAKTAFDALPGQYRHVLELHGIDQTRWDAIRGSGLRTIDGRDYITPDAIRDLPDAVVAEFTLFDLGDNGDVRAAKLTDARRRLEMDLRSLIADETNFGIVEPDARSRRFMTRGLRPGTAAGEAVRFIGQFKGFPVAFTQRVLGRAIYGQRKDAGFIERGGHIGTLLAGMTVAGYVSITLKDIARGQWPPRDPLDGKTIAAAMVQGGAAGLYGDFIFSQTNRFGGDVLESVVGPTIGTAAQAIELGLKARDAGIGLVTGEEAKAPAADAVTLAVSNTPYANLFYLRPALDALFLNSLREAVSPGYLKRQRTNRLNTYGQRPIADYVTGAVQ